MSCEHTNIFNNVINIGDNYLIQQLEDNIKSFLDYGFLNIGGFINVNIPTTGLYGGIFSDLKTVNEPGYKIGQVWQAFRKDWIYETGITYNSISPLNFSGLYINDVFYTAPTGSGNYSYSVNYPLGQIIFDKVVPSSAKIKANYSYRWCQVYKSSSTPQWQELQERTYQPSPQIDIKSSGDYALSASHRIQMPAIVIEPVARSFYKPYQLGATDFVIDQDILLHVFTENSADNYRIVDILRLQKDKTIIMYDIKKVVNSGVYPLNYNGSINLSGYCYGSLLNNFRWNLCYFKDFSVINIENSNKNLYWCTLRVTSQVII